MKICGLAPLARLNVKMQIYRRVVCVANRALDPSPISIVTGSIAAVRVPILLLVFHLAAIVANVHVNSRARKVLCTF